jgi:5-methylcytosine-specific restriction endonuclease McrA
MKFRRRRLSTPRDVYAWNRWKRAVFKRDHYRCIMCGRKRGQKPKCKFDPHHIIRKALRPDIMYEVDNGVTLCRRCHRQTFRKEESFAPRFTQHVSMLRASNPLEVG